MKKQNKLLVFLIVFALLFSLTGNVAIAAAPVSDNTLVTANYSKNLNIMGEPAAEDCLLITPSATVDGASLTMTAAGLGELITVFDLASIGYGTGIEYGFWFGADGMVCFDRDVTLYYQGSKTDNVLKAGVFYSTAGFGERYVPLDDGSMLLILETEAPGNFASLLGDQPLSAFPGTVSKAPANEPEAASEAETVKQPEAASEPSAVEQTDIACTVSNQPLTVNGDTKEIDHYNISGYNYFKLRDLACLLNGTSNTFNVDYDNVTRSISLITGAAYTPIEGDLQVGKDLSATVTLSNQSVTVNGEAANITAYNIGGNNFFKLADLAPFIGFELSYNEAERTVQIATK